MLDYSKIKKNRGEKTEKNVNQNVSSIHKMFQDRDPRDPSFFNSAMRENNIFAEGTDIKPPKVMYYPYY